MSPLSGLEVEPVPSCQGRIIILGFELSILNIEQNLAPTRTFMQETMTFDVSGITTQVAVTSDSPSCPSSKAFDGDLTTFWHSSLGSEKN